MPKRFTDCVELENYGQGLQIANSYPNVPQRARLDLQLGELLPGRIQLLGEWDLGYSSEYS